MKHQNIKQLDGVIAGMSTRKEKLARWADLVDASPRMGICPLYAVENRPVESLRTHGKDDRFWAGTIAFNDPLFRVMGLKSASAWDVVEFFELTRHELHEISCDCISNATAERTVNAIQKAQNAGRTSQAYGRLWRWWNR